jgi:hypothetical protein
MKILLYSILTVLNYGLTYAVQRWDRGRLRPDLRAGAWNGASWGSALYVGGCLSMIAWCWVTRQEWAAWRREGGLGRALGRSALLLLTGLAAAGAIVVVLMGVGELLGWALGIPDDPPG